MTPLNRLAILIRVFNLDQNILQAVQALAWPWLTPIMHVISDLCIPEIAIPLATLWLTFLFWRHRRLQEILLILILVGNGWTLILKPIIHRPRPTVAQAIVYDPQNNFSLPSGHAVAAMTIGGAAILLTKRSGHRQSRWIIGLISAGIFLVGFSRVYLGAHWPSDVLAGYLVGWLWLLFIWRWVRPRLQRRFPEYPQATT